MATVVYNRNTPPFGVPLAGQDGLLSPQWRMYLSQLQTLLNSLQQRYVLRFGGGLTVVGDTIVTYAGTENDLYLFPAGTPILVIHTIAGPATEYLRGIVTSAAWDSGLGKLTIGFTLDSGAAIGTADGLMYGALTSSVLP